LDWERYKQICDTPNVFSRWMLEQTRELTAPLFSVELGGVLEKIPVPKPADHHGERATDMFELSLEPDQVLAIAEEVAQAVRLSRTTSGTAGRGLGGFQEAWAEYAAYGVGRDSGTGSS